MEKRVVYSETASTVVLTSTNALSAHFNFTSVWPLHQTNLTIPEGCMVLDMSSLGFVPWDNPDNIISRETEKIVNTVVGTVCLPVLFAIAVPCNILNMLVFWKQGLKERINLCLFCLSLVDLLHMCDNFVYNFERIRLPFAPSKGFGPVQEFIVNHFLLGFVRGFNALSGFISSLIASERCLCVVSPLRSQTFLKTRTTAVILLVASIFILSGMVLTGMGRSLVCVFDPATYTESKVIVNSKFYSQNKRYLDVLFFFITTLQQFFYVLVVSATTIVTSVKLQKMRTWREQTSSSTLSSREVALTRMLIAVSVLYLVCSLPTIISGIAVMFVPGIGLNERYFNFTLLLISLIELATFINATFNFCVYIVMGSKFKETLWKLLRGENVQPFKESSTKLESA